MNTKSRSRCTVNLGRWLSYAAAGAATTIAASNDADGAILYSGVLNLTYTTPVLHATLQFHTLLSNSHPGARVLGSLIHSATDAGNPPGGTTQSLSVKNKFRMHTNTFGGRGVGFGRFGHAYASKRAYGQSVIGPVNMVGVVNRMAYESGAGGDWKTDGTGFLGFDFNDGGVCYGWARVTISSGGSGPLYNKMTLVDYAYGTPGQVITAGEEVIPSPPSPEPATLGLLAVGAVGLLAIRKGWRPSSARP